MTAEENKQLLEEFFNEIWVEGNIDRLGDFFAEDYVEHGSLGEVRGLSEMRDQIQIFLEAFPERQVEYHDVIATENKVAYAYHGKTTHAGNFAGMEPTGQRVEIDGCAIYRIENGKFVEGFDQNNTLQMLIQLGAVDVTGPVADMLGVSQKATEQPGERPPTPEGGGGGRPGPV